MVKLVSDIIGQTQICGQKSVWYTVKLVQIYMGKLNAQNDANRN
jgi:hypothetical protein